MSNKTHRPAIEDCLTVQRTSALDQQEDFPFAQIDRRLGWDDSPADDRADQDAKVAGCLVAALEFIVGDVDKLSDRDAGKRALALLAEVGKEELHGRN